MKRILFSSASICILGLFIVLTAQVPVSLLPHPWMHFDDLNGKPLSGGKIYTCVAGTACGTLPVTNPNLTYMDPMGVNPNQNPVILDSSGNAAIFWNQSAYHIVVTDRNNVFIREQDNVRSTAFGNLNLPVSVANGGNGTSNPHLTGGPGVTLDGQWPNYTISSNYKGLDVLQFCNTPTVPDYSCLQNGYAAGSVNNTFIVRSPIAMSGQINTPAGSKTVFMDGISEVTAASSVSYGINSSVACAGRDNTGFHINTSWTRTDAFIRMENAGNTGYGGSLSDCMFLQDQPDSTNLATYNQYNSAYVVHAFAPRVHISRNRFVGAWKAINIDQGQSQGSTVEDNEIASYNTGIMIDGPVDVTRLRDNHLWPFGTGQHGDTIATANQIAAFQNNITNRGVVIGRADTVFISGLFTFNGLGMDVITSLLGPSQVYMDHSGLENNGLRMISANSTLVAGTSYIGIDHQEQFAMQIANGTVQFGGRIYAAIVPGSHIAEAQAMVQVGGGGHVKLNNVTMDMKDADQPFVSVQDAFSILTLNDVEFAYTPNLTYTQPVIHMGAGAALIQAMQLLPNNVGSGSRVWFRNDSASNIGIISNVTRQGTTESLTAASQLHLITGTIF